MRKVLAALIVILAVYPVFAQDEDENEYANVKKKSSVANKSVTIQTNPFLPFSDLFTEENAIQVAFSLESQFKVSGRSNIGVEASILYNNEDVAGYPDEGTAGYNRQRIQIGLRPMYILRPFNTGIRGFYIGIYPHFGFLRIQEDKEVSYYGEIGFGMDSGYKFVLRSGLTMQIASGVSKTYGIPKRPDDYPIFNSDGRIGVTSTTELRILDFKVGYSW